MAIVEAKLRRLLGDAWRGVGVRRLLAGVFFLLLAAPAVATEERRVLRVVPREAVVASPSDDIPGDPALSAEPGVDAEEWCCSKNWSILSKPSSSSVTPPRAAADTPNWFCRLLN